MDNYKFKKAYEEVVLRNKDSSLIGTLKEKTLHAVLKNYFTDDNSLQEVKVGSFFADIKKADLIIEIQTKGFDKLRKKLDYFLKEHIVMIVFPIAAKKTISTLNNKTGEVVKTRKSPKQGKIYEIIRELYKIKSFLAFPNLNFCLSMLDIHEYRFIKENNREQMKFEKIPKEIVNEIYIKSFSDYQVFLPDSLNKEFTSKDLKKEAKISYRDAATILNILTSIDVVKRIGKNGNMFIYTITEKVNVCLHDIHSQ